MQASKKNGYDTAHRTAQTFRGEVIDLFAKIEQAVGAVLVHAATLPDYKALKPAFPHLMGLKLERLRQLMSNGGALNSRANGTASLVDKLASFEELRHFMAHGVVEVALKQNGEPIYVFRMITSASGVPSESTLILTRPEAQSRTARLADLAKALATKLEAITDGLAKSSKNV